MKLNRIFLALLLSQMLLLSGIVSAQQNKSTGARPTGTTQLNKKFSPGFVSDGCTMWFNADYEDCCVQQIWIISTAGIIGAGDCGRIIGSSSVSPVRTAFGIS